MQGFYYNQHILQDGSDLLMHDDEDVFMDQLEIYLSSKSSTESESSSAGNPRNSRPYSPWSMFTCQRDVIHSQDLPKRKCETLPVEKPETSKLVIQTPRYYARHITNALNSHDHNYLYNTLCRLSVPRLQITKHVYSYDVKVKGLEERVFGSLQEFCRFMEVWNMFLPDGVFETSSHRQCAANSPTSVFISALYFSGQKVVKGVDVLSDDLCLYYPRLHEMMVNTIDGRKYPDIVELSGSLVIYVNGYGLIDKMEIFCCQMEQ
eukprot:gene5400-5794_t